MYAPIQKHKKQEIKVDLVDNDLYGSTDDQKGLNSDLTLYQFGATGSP